jgi:hypothetical protein
MWKMQFIEAQDAFQLFDVYAIVKLETSMEMKIVFNESFRFLLLSKVLI